MKVTPAPESSDLLVGQVLPGGLQVLERLGGTNEEPLYRAQYPRTGPPVLLMILKVPGHAPDSSAVPSPSTRFWQQLLRACQIRHPNVASLLEIGKARGGTIYAVGELLTGQLLSEVLSTRGTLPLAEAVEVCLQAAAGLQAAHGVGVAHGSVSPRTILITTGDDDRVLVKLIGFDFSWYEAYRGLDQVPDDRYSSPERLAGSVPDEASDVFSLGAVLHHMLGGTPPGEAAARASIPPALRRIINRALAPSDRRYPNVAAFAEALARASAVAGQGKPARRWRSGWLAAGIATLLVAASLWFGWDRIRPTLADLPSRLKPRPGAVKPVAVTPPRSPSADTRVAPERRKPEVENGAVSRSKVADTASTPADSAPEVSSGTSERGDTIRGPYISPFRRSHPWAAHPNGRSYFPSSCPMALASSELIYFRSEEEARATGRSRSTAPGCS
jgi:serine/threonine protein kinase